MSETPQDPAFPNPYEDPELLEQAGGDKKLLDWLVGLKNTQELLAERPDDPVLQASFEAMQKTIDEYRSQKG
jgi:hypothetical protein